MRTIHEYIKDEEKLGRTVAFVTRSRLCGTWTINITKYDNITGAQISSCQHLSDEDIAILRADGRIVFDFQDCPDELYDSLSKAHEEHHHLYCY
jgi:hypothetical protein